MEHKQAADILIKILHKGELDAQEKEAVETASGVLAWTYLGQKRIKGKKIIK